MQPQTLDDNSKRTASTKEHYYTLTQGAVSAELPERLRARSSVGGAYRRLLTLLLLSCLGFTKERIDDNSDAVRCMNTSPT